MPTTDNHPARRALAAIAVIALLTLVAFLVAGKWAVFVPIVLIPLWRFAWSSGPRGHLAGQGWSGRRFKNYWIYEEKQGKERPSLSLKLERAGLDRFVLVVPPEAEWRRTMPLWAAERRDEIMRRVTESWAPEDVKWPPGETPPESPRQSVQ